MAPRDTSKSKSSGLNAFKTNLSSVVKHVKATFRDKIRAPGGTRSGMLRKTASGTLTGATATSIKRPTTEHREETEKDPDSMDVDLPTSPKSTSSGSRTLVSTTNADWFGSNSPLTSATPSPESALTSLPTSFDDDQVMADVCSPQMIVCGDEDVEMQDAAEIMPPLPSVDIRSIRPVPPAPSSLEHGQVKELEENAKAFSPKPASPQKFNPFLFNGDDAPRRSERTSPAPAPTASRLPVNRSATAPSDPSSTPSDDKSARNLADADAGPTTICTPPALDTERDTAPDSDYKSTAPPLNASSNATRNTIRSIAAAVEPYTRGRKRDRDEDDEDEDEGVSPRRIVKLRKMATASTVSHVRASANESLNLQQVFQTEAAETTIFRATIVPFQTPEAERGPPRDGLSSKISRAAIVPFQTAEAEPGPPQGILSSRITPSTVVPFSTRDKIVRVPTPALAASNDRQDPSASDSSPCTACGIVGNDVQGFEKNTGTSSCPFCHRSIATALLGRATLAQHSDASVTDAVAYPSPSVQAEEYDTVRASGPADRSVQVAGKTVETTVLQNAPQEAITREPTQPLPTTHNLPVTAALLGQTTPTSEPTRIKPSSPADERSTKVPVQYGSAIGVPAVLARPAGEQDGLEAERPTLKVRRVGDSTKLTIPVPLWKRATQVADGVLAYYSGGKSSTRAVETSRSKHSDWKPYARTSSRKHTRDEDTNPSTIAMKVQTTTCQSRAVKHMDMPCKACITRKSVDNCRWKGVRCFLYATVTEVVESVDRKGKHTRKETTYLKAIEGPYFASTTRDDAVLAMPSQWNTNFTPELVTKLKVNISENMVDILQRELEHASREGAIRCEMDASHRRTCDICLTGLLSGSFMCRHCGEDVCFDCYKTIKSGEEVGTRCNGRRSHRGHCHEANDFFAFTAFGIPELEEHLTEMRKTLSDDKTASQKSESDTNAAPTSSGQPPAASATTDNVKSDMDVDNVAEAYGYAAGAPTWAHPLDPSGVGSLPFPSFHHSELTEDTFNHLWARGEPLVVRGVLENSTIPWTPDYFKSEYGGVSCTIVDCEDDNAIGVSTTVGEFFDRFREHEDGEKVLKLKDWPPTASFSETAPVLYEDFHAMIPMGNYTRRDGVLNIASHFPTDAIAPDLGPKMYNAFASRETPGGKGSTRLHKDIADAVNIMVYAAPNDGKEGCAVWDIFPQADSEKICSFLKEHFKPTDNMDPIHSQSYYLDSALRKKLFDKYGVKSWRMYQRAGEAVFIPAGCAHQVCNLADAIKVAVDFVSPHNIARCAQLTEEFRSLNTTKPWKEDVLNLYTTMWFAWLSCRSQERRRVKGKGRAGKAA